MSPSQDHRVTWKNVPTRTINAGGIKFAYRELGRDNPGTPVVFLVHLAAVLDNWDPRVVDGFAAEDRVVVFDNRGVGASSGSPMELEHGPVPGIRIDDEFAVRQTPRQIVRVNACTPDNNYESAHF